MLDVKLLRTFREVAVRGSFSDAAEALAFTQPAVSQHVAKLEKGLGVRLLDRDARGVALTAAGEVLLHHADEILTQLVAAERAVVAVAGVKRPRVRVAAFPTCAAGLVPPAFRLLRDTHPELDAQLLVLEPEPAIEELLRGDVELGMLADSPAAPAPAIGGVEYEHLMDDPMVVALPMGHHLAGRSTVELVELRDEPWATVGIHGICGDGMAIRIACEDAGFEPEIGFQFDDYQAIQGVVASGMAVALIPALAGGIPRPDLVIKPLRGRPPFRRILGARRTGEHDPHVDRVIAALRDAGRALPLPGRPRLAVVA